MATYGAGEEIQGCPQGLRHLLHLLGVFEGYQTKVRVG